MRPRLPLCLALGGLLLAPPWAPALPAAAEPQTVEKKELFEKSLEAAVQALEVYGELDRPKELRRVVEIGYRLAQQSVFQEMPFTFYLVDMAEPNAFALPGGQIFLTRGMLDLPLDDEMLAGLLGHELGHVVLEHGIKMKRRATLLNVLSQAVLAGVIIGADGGSQRPTSPYDPTGGAGNNRGDIIYGTAAAGAVVSELLLRNYSREFEDEADEEGQRLAAAAGFDPDGTSQLMDTMRAHMPQSREYGYWRTHPFFEERVRAASVRQELLKVQQPEPAAAYRQTTQGRLMRLADGYESGKPELTALLRRQALVVWPQGEVADGLRLAELRERRDAVLAKQELRRDFGSLIGLYRRHLEEVRELTPESPLIAILEKEVGGFARSRDELYPRAVGVFESGIYETEFLETFRSNFPEAPELPEAALALATAYSRLGRPGDAIELYLEASAAAAAGSEAGRRATNGLRNLAPSLKQLDALQRLADDGEDPEIRRLAGERLAQLASTYKELANGAAYLKSFPNGAHAEAVTARLNSLAEKLHGEVILYQAVGDNVKGIERIQQILTHAPNSPAAAKLRERMVLES